MAETFDRRTATRYRKRLIALASDAQETDAWERGSRWYPRARRFCEDIALEHGLPLVTVTGVVAVTSPQVPWDYQLSATGEFIRLELARSGSGRYAGFSTNVDKARRILRGEKPEDVLRGPKVTAFYANILGQSHKVTLDRWAIRAACGKSEAPPKKLKAIRVAYQEAARALSLPVSALQAIIWEHMRSI